MTRIFKRVLVMSSRRYAMAKKKYKIETACPQCGCSAVSHLTKEEIEERYGEVENVEMECQQCMLKYQTSREKACPEWDEECRLKEKV